MRYISILTLLLLTSCTLLPIQNVEQQVMLIKMVARTSTHLGLTELVEDDAERLEMAQCLRDDIAANVLSFLNNDNVEISTENCNMLLAKVPDILRPHLLNALDILNSYMGQANVTDVLDENATRLLRAFFVGVVEGCDLIILSTEAGETHDWLGAYSRAHIEEYTN